MNMIKIVANWEVPTNQYLEIDGYIMCLRQNPIVNTSSPELPSDCEEIMVSLLDLCQ